MNEEREEIEDRRKFLLNCGRFAAVTPPAMTLLLSTSLTSAAIARCGDGSPNGKDDYRRGLLIAWMVSAIIPGGRAGLLSASGIASR